MISAPQRLLIFLTMAFMGLNGFSQPVTGEGVPASGSREEVLLIPEASRTQEVDVIREAWQLAGLEAAIREGFLGIARTLSERVSETDLNEVDLERLLNYRLQIALATGDRARATEVVETARGLEKDLDPLLEAYLAFFNGQSSLAEELLRSGRPTRIPSAQAWQALLEGLLASAEGRQSEANEAFARAVEAVKGTLLADHFEAVRLREELRAGPLPEESISALRESVRSMQGERGGFEAARLLAIALVRNGREAAAIDILNAHLTLPGIREFGLRADFLLLIGMIAGPDSPRGQLALQQLVSEGEGGDTLSIALTLLTQALGNGYAPGDFLTDLDSWLGSDTPHALEDRLLAYRAYLLTGRESYEEAGEAINRILEEYPASAYVNDGLRMMAYTSWNQNPPRYRTAADYLTRLRDRLPAGPERIRVGILIADCYFLNEDYASASDAYGAVFEHASAEKAGLIFFQRVLAEIGRGRPEAALEILESGQSDERLSADILWRAEWNLIDYWRREGQIERAFARIEEFLGTGGGRNDIPGELELRMHWLAARLSLEAGAYAAAEEKANLLRERLGLPPFSLLDPLLVEAVDSHLLLLMGQARYFLEEADRAMIAFRELRNRFPRSGPAILSYLFESRQESQEDNLVSAQQSLIGLVDRFPDSEYAPIALWEAALNAEKRGLNVHLREAISILERLVSDYPDHGLVYFARLKQGDLARRLNDFPTALILYERLLTVYPDHPQRYRAELSRADCLAALGSEDRSRYDAAIVIYERNCLLTQAPHSVRLEAGYKWAQALRRLNDEAGSEAVLWLLHERFLTHTNEGRWILRESAGRYWMARTLFDLATLQEEKQETASALRILRRIVRLGLPGSASASLRIENLENQTSS